MKVAIGDRSGLRLGDLCRAGGPAVTIYQANVPVVPSSGRSAKRRFDVLSWGKTAATRSLSADRRPKRANIVLMHNTLRRSGPKAEAGQKLASAPLRQTAAGKHWMFHWGFHCKKEFADIVVIERWVFGVGPLQTVQCFLGSSKSCCNHIRFKFTGKSAQIKAGTMGQCCPAELPSHAQYCGPSLRCAASCCCSHAHAELHPLPLWR